MCADNCSDGTAAQAEAAGAVVFETVDNTAQEGRRAQPGARHPPAGARATRTPSSSWTPTRLLAPTFVAEARGACGDGVGGVGGAFTGRAGGGFVGMLQRNEYARYARDVARLKGKVLVLTGTATLFSARTLRHVVERALEGSLPGGSRRSTTRTSSPRTTSSRSPSCTSATRSSRRRAAASRPR